MSLKKKITRKRNVNTCPSKCCCPYLPCSHYVGGRVLKDQGQNVHKHLTPQWRLKHACSTSLVCSYLNT